MLAWLHSTFDIIAHMEGKTNGFTRTFGQFGFGKCSHTYPFKPNASENSPRALSFYLTCNPHHLVFFCKNYKHNSDFKKEG